MVTIYVAGFQTVAIFVQTGVDDKSVDATTSISDDVEDSSHKVCILRKKSVITLFNFVCSAFSFMML